MESYVIQVLQEDRWLNLSGGSLHSRSDEAVSRAFATYKASEGAPTADATIELAQKLAVESHHLKRAVMRVVKRCPITEALSPVWEQREAGKPEGYERG